MYPLLHSVVFKALRFEYVVASWSIAIAFMFAAIGMADVTQSIAALMIYIPLSGILLLENHRQDLILYFVPLSAFMNGVETVSTFIEAIEKNRIKYYKEHNVTDVYDLSGELEM
eukprot:gene33987-41917_t